MINPRLRASRVSQKISTENTSLLPYGLLFQFIVTVNFTLAFAQDILISVQKSFISVVLTEYSLQYCVVSLLILHRNLKYQSLPMYPLTLQLFCCCFLQSCLGFEMLHADYCISFSSLMGNILTSSFMCIIASLAPGHAFLFPVSKYLNACAVSTP
jgi:hypothetical protein